MLSSILLSASRSARLRQIVATTRCTRPVVDRFVAGEDLGDALGTVRELTAAGLTVTLDYLGEDVTDRAGATAVRDAYLRLLDMLGPEGLGTGAEVSVKLSAFGQALEKDGHDVALANVRQVCQAADVAGTTVTLDMEDHTTVDSTLAILDDLRKEHPATGAVLQSYLYRTEEDCHRLAVPGSRVRLVKGAYREPSSVAYQDKHQVDLAYVRCLRVLMAGGGYPMIGSHDPRLIRIAQDLASRYGRAAGEYEFQMLYGIRTDEQHRLVEQGERVRVYTPYGSDWYGYFMRRLAERPANLAFFLRSFVPSGPRLLTRH
ncbi:proline dehydrogenase [Wenjunlia vitaminophila]|uniref:proline dehydrogenase n=1 Tax=Wenjunlia vitaminophila TaxID=76728 RepID=A0A0T6LSF5_WENVI|nr:proline dehydrogenase family protein [Wenjunlia vitaminophila]KRV49059.1 proline dehydrogenase [Wenjunlia vitaminophila]